MSNFIRWYKVSCDTCEQAFYWSRTNEKDIDLLTINGGTEVPLCAQCKAENEAYNEGVMKGKGAYLHEFTDEGLAAEINRRKAVIPPVVLGNNLPVHIIEELQKMCKAKVAGDFDNDSIHCLWEEMMVECFGPKVWDWWNK